MFLLFFKSTEFFLSDQKDYLVVEISIDLFIVLNSSRFGFSTHLELVSICFKLRHDIFILGQGERKEYIHLRQIIKLSKEN